MRGETSLQNSHNSYVPSTVTLRIAELFPQTIPAFFSMTLRTNNKYLPTQH
jgi:hypothetical protein